MAANGPIEPSANMREMANNLRQMYLALVYEGFTEQQALIVIGQILGAARGSSS